MDKSLTAIRKINKTIVRPDGTIDSFEKQLMDLLGGTYDTTKPLVISSDSRCLGYLDIDIDKPLTMRVKTAWKLRDVHHIDFPFVGRCPELLSDSVLAFDSITHSTSKVIVLDICNADGDPYIAICRTDRRMNMVEVNEITSIYDKQNFDVFLTRTFGADKTFYKNKKTEQYIKSHRLQLPKEMMVALSIDHSNRMIRKSQAAQGFEGHSEPKEALDQIIKSAAERCGRKHAETMPPNAQER